MAKYYKGGVTYTEALNLNVVDLIALTEYANECIVAENKAIDRIKRG